MTNKKTDKKPLCLSVNTIADTSAGKISVLEFSFGVKIRPDLYAGRSSVVGVYHPHKTAGKNAIKLSDRQYSDSMAALAKERFCELVPPMPDAVDVVTLLAEKWHVYVIVSINGLTGDVARQWLCMHDVPHSGIILCRRDSRMHHHNRAQIALDHEHGQLIPLATSETIPVLVLPPAVTRGGKLVKAPPNLPKQVRVVRGLREAHHELTALAAT